jgi:heavy metal sensor kinase
MSVIQDHLSTEREHSTRWLSLRVRLALWSVSLVFLLSLGLLLFLNIIALSRFSAIMQRVSSPASPVVLHPQPQRINRPVLPSAPGSLPQGVNRPKVVAPPEPLVARLVEAFTHSSIRLNPLQATVLDELQSISLIGLVLVAILGGGGAYWLAGIALRPLRQVSQTAQHISAQTLKTRLGLTGPQDEIKELADAFDTMLARLEQAFEQQGRFVANVAHELRTPLATMRAHQEVVTTNPHASLEEYRDLAAVQERALTRLEALVNNMLLLLRGEQPLGVRQVVSLGPVVEEVLHHLTPQANQRQVTLQVSDAVELLVQGDEVLLERVFCNLIENAICYNRPSGQVQVHLRQSGEHAQVEVVDTGVGIAPEEQERIFDRFYRVDRSRSRHSGGAGLGLSIVSTLVAQHGGMISLRSTPGEGSVFTVSLPLSAAASSTDAPDEAQLRA